jgi:hypothetical protein
MAGVLLVVAVIWLLRTADTVFLPLAFAVFLIGLFWPLQRRLQRRLPRVAAMLLTLARFESTHWIAVLLSDVDDEGEPAVASPASGSGPR